MQINKKKVQINFSAAAPHYDQISTMQSEIGRRLISFLTISHAAKILDIGTGTGRLLGNVMNFFPSSEFHGCDLAYGMIRQAFYKASERVNSSPTRIIPFIFLQADAEKLPYRSSVFDLVISNSTYQWVPNINDAFREVCHILKSEGKFCFSTFGEGTLYELHCSFQQAYQKLKIDTFQTHIQVFLSLQNLEEILGNCGFSRIISKEFIITRIYSEVHCLLKELKAMGSSNVMLDRSAGLGGRRILKEMMKWYEKNFRDGEGVRATYRIILIQAEKRKTRGQRERKVRDNRDCNSL